MGCSALDRANFALSRETRDMLAAAIDSMGGPPVDKHKAPPRPAPPRPSHSAGSDSREAAVSGSERGGRPAQRARQRVRGGLTRPPRG